ncbi:hypothetical protein GDO78_020469 [Eleutherodactylus coqui]|uniref:Uncharacterized protein n=1 Tax=Eleutherodactylus coqui TaxID=57060 RepID=A0A8J6EHM7_ELECQ|nr:hypothetical protein GDO78_020469 [Eleutherodactylus coqui]
MFIPVKDMKCLPHYLAGGLLTLVTVSMSSIFPYVAKCTLGRSQSCLFQPCHVSAIFTLVTLLLVRIIMVQIFAGSCWSALYGQQVTLYFSLYTLQMYGL